MHRLREWFGIKDWQGPPKQSLLNPDQENKENKEEKLATSLNNTEKDIDSQQRRRDRPQHPLYDKVEEWSKQYIPHKEGTCYSCKLIALGATAFYGTASAGFVIAKYKKIDRKSRPLFILTGTALTAMSISLFYLTFNDEHPMDIIRKKKD